MRWVGFVLLAACGGQTTSAATQAGEPDDPCTSAEATPVASTELSHSQTLLTDEHFIYWTGGDYENVVVRRARKSGGAPQDMASIHLPHPSDVEIALTRDFVVLETFTGRLDGEVLYRIPKGGGDAVAFASVAGSPFLVADAQRAYVGTLAIPLDGSAITDLGLAGAPFAVGIDASRVYVIADNGLLGVGFDKTVTQYASQRAFSGWPIAIDDHSIYFYDESTPRIGVVPKAGGPSADVVALEEGHTVCGIHIDARFAYWCDFQTHAPTSASTWRVATSGSTPKEFVMTDPIATMDSSCMYWIGSIIQHGGAVAYASGTIMKKLKPQ